MAGVDKAPLFILPLFNIRQADQSPVHSGCRSACLMNEAGLPDCFGLLQKGLPMNEERSNMSPDFWRIVDTLTPLCQELATKYQQRQANPKAWRIRELVAELRALANLPDDVLRALEGLVPLEQDAAVEAERIEESAKQIAESLCYQWYAVASETAREKEHRPHPSSPLIPCSNDLLESVCDTHGTTRLGAEKLIRKAFDSIVPIGSSLKLPPSLRGSGPLTVERVGEKEYRMYYAETA